MTEITEWPEDFPFYANSCNSNVARFSMATKYTCGCILIRGWTIPFNQRTEHELFQPPDGDDHLVKVTMDCGEIGCREANEWLKEILK
jgi:hypothetical protein